MGEVQTSEVAFLDHVNLAEQGAPIKTYYRDDLVHLYSQGVIRFAQNLEKEISRILKKDGQEDHTDKTEHLHNSNGDGRMNYRGLEPCVDKEGGYSRSGRAFNGKDNYPRGRYDGQLRGGNTMDYENRDGGGYERMRY